ARPRLTLRASRFGFSSGLMGSSLSCCAEAVPAAASARIARLLTNAFFLNFMWQLPLCKRKGAHHPSERVPRHNDLVTNARAANEPLHGPAAGPELRHADARARAVADLAGDAVGGLLHQRPPLHLHAVGGRGEREGGH